MREGGPRFSLLNAVLDFLTFFLTDIFFVVVSNFVWSFFFLLQSRSVVYFTFRNGET